MKKNPGVKLLRVSPEKAVNVLRRLATEGYAIRWTQEGSVFNVDTPPSERESISADIYKYEHELVTWAKRASNELTKIFASDIEAFKFAYSGVTDRPRRSLYLYVGDKNEKVEIRKELVAKISFLETYIDLIMSRFEVNLSAGRDINIQSGVGNKMEIRNVKKTKVT